MSEPYPAEEQDAACGEQLSMRPLADADGSAGPAAPDTAAHEPAAEEPADLGAASEASQQGSETDGAEVVDGLIAQAIATADAAVDDICAYLADRPPIRGWQREYPGESFPYLGRGYDQVCSALRRRLRSRQGWAPRRMGAVRPPRRRRVP
jgi:hypothetical protein